MNRIQQLNQTILELRLRVLSERSEIRALRHINKGQKNALDAAHAQIEHLKEREASLIARWDSSHIKQRYSEYEREISDLKRQHSDQRMMTNADITDTSFAAVTCMDARQYESLSVTAAFGAGMVRYSEAFGELAKK